MRRSWGPLPLELLLLLALLTLRGDGNEGSVAGSCRCDKVFSSNSPPPVQFTEHFRKQVRFYQRCPPYVRFHLRSRSVCGGSKDQWVRELMSCFDLKDCGYGNPGSVARWEHLPPPSTQVPGPTERAPSDMVTPAQTYLPSTQQPTRPTGALSLDKKLTHTSETTTSTLGHSLVSGPVAGENQKQLKENVGSATGTSVTVAVPSLLAIVFFLTGVLLYVLCKRRREQSLQYSPGLQLHYTPVAPDSEA